MNTVTSALLCIEEPEIYLHPHARRVISDRLDDFIEGDRNQVIITTHSSEFIRTILSDLKIILVQRQEYDTRALPINLKDYKYLLIDNNKCEIFFADKVIICEGYDEYILKAITEELFPRKLDEHNISIISSGGKDNIRPLTKLMLKLGIKCFIFTDFDFLLRDQGGESKKYECKFHESIVSLGKDFFCQTCICGADGEEIHGKLNKLRTDLKRQNEQSFYTGKKIEEFDNKNLPEIISKLKQKGIGILNGEIEDTVIDHEFLPVGKKISLDKVYELGARINNGQKPSAIFNTTQIVEFLNTVFNK